MILLDAIYINQSGGKVLLDYLIEVFESEHLDCFYLLDARLENEYPELAADRCMYMPASLLKRHRFYKKRKDRFEKILCFRNLPPSVKCKADVYTFFHQSLYLKVPENVGLRQRLMLKLKSRILGGLINNTNYFLVQTPTIKKGLIKRYNLKESKVWTMPFYPSLPEPDPSIKAVENTFIYVSSGAEHKNHPRLLEAFKQFYQKYGKGELIVTIPEFFPDVYEQIQGLQEQGIPIKNIGYISHDELSSHYAAAQYMIFPSLAECLPLGLVESMQFDLKVLAANLDYTYEVLKPSVSFDPLDIQAIFKAFERTLNEELPKTEPVVSNQIGKIVELMRPTSPV